MSAATRSATRVAGAGSACGSRAAFEAVENAIAALAQEPGLILVFPSGDSEPQDVARQVAAAAGDTPAAGMTGSGVIGTGGPIETGCSALAFASSISAGVGVGSRASEDPRRAARIAARDAVASVGAARGVTALLLFVDPDCGDQADVVAGAYEVAGGRVPLAGGAAGGPKIAQFVNGRASRDAVVAVAIGAGVPIGVGITHGCITRGAPSIVTRSEGHTVLELDGRPAETVYLEKLGFANSTLADAELEAIAMVHPLAQPALSGDIRLRYVRGRAGGGGLICATAIPANAAVEVCEQTPERVLASAREAVENALTPLGGAPAGAAVVFDCAARRHWSRDRIAERELDVIASAFGDEPPPLAGVYTRGEIGRVRGATGDRNHSLVLVAVGAAD